MWFSIIEVSGPIQKVLSVGGPLIKVEASLCKNFSALLSMDSSSPREELMVFPENGTKTLVITYIKQKPLGPHLLVHQQCADPTTREERNPTAGADEVGLLAVCKEGAQVRRTFHRESG